MSGGPKPLPFIQPPAWLGAPLGGSAREVDEAPGAGSGDTAAADNAKKLQAIKDLLSKSATGAAAFKFLEDKKLKVEFANGGGSFWDGSRMVIGDTKVEDAALAVVHEVNHARSTLDGTKPDPKALTKDDYVRKMLEEEATGTVDSIKTKNELVAAGVAITARFPLEAKYNEAYKKASEDLAKANPKATPAQLRAAGEKAGFARVLKGFEDGEVKGSKSKKPYPEVYGNRWDKHNP
jgi:hypothetical protein